TTLPFNTSRIALVNISTGLYYTVEVRDNNQTVTSPFDGSLPDHGVLITLCNDSATDEVLYGRPGVCVVQNAQPAYSSKDHATYDIEGGGENSRFEDPVRNIVVEVLSKNGSTGSYEVRISHQQLELYWFYIDGTSNWQTVESTSFNLDVTLKNTGATSISNVYGALSTAVPSVTITAPANKSYGTITAGSLKNSSAQYHVTLPASVAATPMNFTLAVSFTGAPATSFHIQIPVRKESVKPTLSLSSPANGTYFNASEPIDLLGTASDAGGIFKVWYRNYWLNGTSESWWEEMNFNSTHVYATDGISGLGNHTITVRVMDKSGNVVLGTVRVIIIDEIPPTLMLTVNTLDDQPSRFATLGTELYIGAVVQDNNQVLDVEISINGGAFFSIKNNTGMVTMGTNGSYLGYYYDWTPSIEGNQLIMLRGTDISLNSATTEWQMTTISTQTIMYIIIALVVIMSIFSCIGSYARRRTTRARYRVRYSY
nr:Ig-like domain-containing protein [Candidatus Sigynarchaeota archaeon]